jgi:type IV secretion system protein TrbI
MSEPNKNQTPEPVPSAGGVRDRTFRPAGLLPKNTQTYVILGITVVMVGAIAFSGGNGTQAKKAVSNEQRTSAAIDPNLARIQEYRTRIDEQARKLAAEQAQLEQTKQALGLPTATQVGTIPNLQMQPMAYGTPAYPQPVYAQQPAYGQQPAKPEKSVIEAEKEKREYQSLFASNVALSYRKETESAEATHPNTAAQPGAIAPPPYSLPYVVSTGTAQPTTESTQAKAPTKEPAADKLEREHRTVDATLRQATGKQHRLFEGTLIETVLTNRLDGSFSGPVNCLVTTDVYSHDLQDVLIPRGTRVLGEVRRNDNLGQQRLAVSFHRLIMPDGYSVSLDQFTGLNQIGETGLRDKVNHHYAQVFGVSLAIGAIAGLANVNTGYGADSSSMDAYRQGVASSLSQSSLRILDRYLNILPTFTIREGKRVKVILTDDLMLPDYARHTVPSDL